MWNMEWAEIKAKNYTVVRTIVFDTAGARVVLSTAIAYSDPQSW